MRHENDLVDSIGVVLRLDTETAVFGILLTSFAN